MDEGKFDVEEEVLIDCFHDAGYLEERLERLRWQRKQAAQGGWVFVWIIGLLLGADILDLVGVTSISMDFESHFQILLSISIFGLYSHCRSILALHRIQALRLIQDQRAAQ